MHRFERALVALSVLALAATSLACPQAGRVGSAVLERFTPKVKFKHMDLTRLDFGDVEVMFMFDLDNPAPEDVVLEDVVYHLDVAGKRVTQAQPLPTPALNANDGATVAIPVRVPYDRLLSTLGSAARGKDRLPYDLSGNFHFRTPKGPVTIVAEALGGDFPVVRPPDITWAGSSVRVELEPLHLVVNLALDVAYPDGGTAIALGEVEYRFALGETTVASGQTLPLGGIEGGGRIRVNIPLRVPLVNLAAVAEALAAGETLKARFSGALTVETPFGPLRMSIDERGAVGIGDP